MVTDKMFLEMEMKKLHIWKLCLMVLTRWTMSLINWLSCLDLNRVNKFFFVYFIFKDIKGKFR